MVLDFDLNDPAPCGDSIIDIPFHSLDPQELKEEQPLQSQQQEIIDLDAIDDDVLPSSPRTSYEARSKFRRETLYEEETLYKGLELSFPERIWFPQNPNKRRRTVPHPKGADWECCSNMETFRIPPESPPSVPPQVVPALTCPVCMGQLVKEMTTKCGHIFCEKCIKAAISAQHKCPTCRQKLTVRSIHRIYLPAAS